MSAIARARYNGLDRLFKVLSNPLHLDAWGLAAQSCWVHPGSDHGYCQVSPWLKTLRRFELSQQPLAKVVPTNDPMPDLGRPDRRPQRYRHHPASTSTGRSQGRLLRGAGLRQTPVNGGRSGS